MDIVKLQAFWFLVFTLILVLVAVWYIYRTGTVLSKEPERKKSESLLAHRVATSFFLPASLGFALLAVVSLATVSGSGYRPFLLFCVHIFFVTLLVWSGSMTWYIDGLKNPARHRQLAHWSWRLFLVVILLGCWLAAYNPVIRGVFAHYSK